MKQFFKEFKEFISRGNVFDMAVGLIIATAFNKIVSSLVNDIIMPLITWATGASSLADLSVALRWDENGNVTLSWAYGNFIQTVIDFLIIAFSIFCMVKIVNSSRKKFKELEQYAIAQSSKEIKAEKKQVKAQAKQDGVPFKKAWKEHQDKKLAQLEAKKKLDEEQKALAEQNKPKIETTEQILKDIRDLLKQQNKQDDKVKKGEQENKVKKD